MIIPCPNCGQKNKIPDRPRTDGVYKCGDPRCKMFLLHHRVEFHSRLINDVVSDLKNIKQKLESIKFAIFHQKEIYFLKEDYDRTKSRLQNWIDYTEFIRDPIERQEIYGTYKQQLSDIKQEIGAIANLIDKKEEIKKTIRKFKLFREAVEVLNSTLGLANFVLESIGIQIPEEIKYMLGDIQIFLIEGGLNRD
jgi:hypothetical protein